MGKGVVDEEDERFLGNAALSDHDFIHRAIDNVTEAVRDGAILVVIILFIFLLNFRTTFITLTAIPLSLLMTAIVFAFFGLSINTMTLGGLAVAIGELVDDAIVVGESIYHHAERGQSPREAALLGTREIAWPVIVAVITTIISALS